METIWQAQDAVLCVPVTNRVTYSESLVHAGNCVPAFQVWYSCLLCGSCCNCGLLCCVHQPWYKGNMLTSYK